MSGADLFEFATLRDLFSTTKSSLLVPLPFRPSHLSVPRDRVRGEGGLRGDSDSEGARKDAELEANLPARALTRAGREVQVSLRRET
eukprot:1595232-Rhodomonas_salina.2